MFIITVLHCLLLLYCTVYYYRIRIRNRNGDIFFNFARLAAKLRYYGDVVHSFYWKSTVEHDGGLVFKMRDSVLSARYSAVCNVLRLWKTSLIPTYHRVGRLYK